MKFAYWVLSAAALASAAELVYATRSLERGSLWGRSRILEDTLVLNYFPDDPQGAVTYAFKVSGKSGASCKGCPGAPAWLPNVLPGDEANLKDLALDEGVLPVRYESSPVMFSLSPRVAFSIGHFRKASSSRIGVLAYENVLKGRASASVEETYTLVSVDGRSFAGIPEDFWDIAPPAKEAPFAATPAKAPRKIPLETIRGRKAVEQ